MTSDTFQSIELPNELLKAVDSLGYQKMTPVQAKSLPYILEKRDVLAKAKTGSGKTAAFSLGVLAKIDLSRQGVQALILSPTRELADQLALEIRRLARFMPNVRVLTLCGGKPIRSQVESLQHGAHIVVGTPGRILDHLKRASLKLGNIQTLVLDEADRMLEMGFDDAITEVIKKTPNQRQTLLFSATFPEEIRKTSKKLQKKPIEVTIDSEHERSQFTQLFYEIKKHERNNTLLRLLCHYKPESSIIFCNTKVQCRDVAQLLKGAGYHALAIHGDLEQRQREEILIQFANKSCTILVATDVAARGLDIDNIEAVINYEIARGAETHLHRIGRTARAGLSGLALSMYTSSEVFKLNAIETLQKSPVICDVPESLDDDPNYRPKAGMRTLCLLAGKKQKLRPGDILGALTGDVGLAGQDVGKIHIGDYCSYVAIKNKFAKQACQSLQNHKIKGRNIKAQLVR